jgi:acetaldehyde dehydrogenase (acetylating)
MAKLKVAILGSGNIGTDLLVKLLRSNYLEPTAFIGRNTSSLGMKKARELGIDVSDEGINFIINNPDCCDLVFDATSASAHLQHSSVFEKLNKFVIDMTPSKIGKMCVPSVNLAECLKAKNVNMVTCGGQAAIPLCYAISQTQKDLEYLEIVSSIASTSAGPATRSNLDEYIHTTENGIKYFTGVGRSKAILNLNPAVPCIIMKTTIFAKVRNPDLDALKAYVAKIATTVRKYVPGYEIIVGPVVENARIIITVMVRGLGDYLPEYAGNLDIINCAAVEMAEQYATN